MKIETWTMQGDEGTIYTVRAHMNTEHNYAEHTEVTVKVCGFGRFAAALQAEEEMLIFACVDGDMKESDLFTLVLTEDEDKVPYLTYPDNLHPEQFAYYVELFACTAHTVEFPQDEVSDIEVPFKDPAAPWVLCRFGTREDIVEWLQWNDSNGLYGDEARTLEGLDPMTHEEARDELRLIAGDL